MPRLLTSGVQFLSHSVVNLASLSSCCFVSNSVMSSTQHFNYPASYPAPMIPSNYHIQSFPANFNSIAPSVRSFPANFNSIAPSVRSIPADLRPTGYPIHPIGYPIHPNPTYFQPSEYHNARPAVQSLPIYFQPSEYHNARPAVQSLPAYSHQAGPGVRIDPAYSHQAGPGVRIDPTYSPQAGSGVQSLPTNFHQTGLGVRIVPTYSGSISMRSDVQSLPIYFKKSVPNDQSDPTSSRNMRSGVQSYPTYSHQAKPDVRIVTINSGLIRRRQNDEPQSLPTSLNSISSLEMGFKPRIYEIDTQLHSYAVPLRRDVGTQTEYVYYREYSPPRTTSPFPTVTKALAKLSVIIGSSEKNTGMLGLMQRREEIGSPSPNPRTLPPNQTRVLPVTRPSIYYLEV